jgi:hypothetical protein
LAHEGRIGVLGCVTAWNLVYFLKTHSGCSMEDQPVEVEPSHQNDTVNAHLPLLCKHPLRFSPEVNSRNILVAIFLSLEELFALRKANTDETDSNRDASCCPKYRLKLSLAKITQTISDIYVYKYKYLPSTSLSHHQHLSWHMPPKHTQKHSLAARFRTSDL